MPELTEEIMNDIKSDLFKNFQYYGDTPIGSVHAWPKFGGTRLNWVYTGTSFSFNRIFGARLSDREANKKIKDIVDFFEKKNALAVWLIDQSSKPSDLGERLDRYGFKYGETLTDMHIDLSAVNSEPFLGDKQEINVIKVSNENEHSIWIDTSCEGRGVNEEIGRINCRKIFENMKYENSLPYQYYLGYYKDNPVCTYILFAGELGAGLQCISTIPEWRNHGFASAITACALKDAHLLGYDIAFLQANKSSENIYKKLGFKKDGCTRMYIYIPKGNDKKRECKLSVLQNLRHTIRSRLSNLTERNQKLDSS